MRGVDTPRHTPTIVGIGYSDWFYWDGRKDSQWAQALARRRLRSSTAAVERHTPASCWITTAASTRRCSARARSLGHAPFSAGGRAVEDETLRAAWDGMTSEDQGTVNRVFANIGKSIAAYSRRILPGRSRFDDYASAALANDQGAWRRLSARKSGGLRLFIGDGQCTDCHNGPLFTNGTFHNIGLPLPEGENFDQAGRRDVPGRG